MLLNSDAKKLDMPETIQQTELKPRQHTGVILDRSTGEPIVGARVTVRREMRRDVVRTSVHVTNERGEYSFEISEDDLQNKSLYLELDVEHDAYCPSLGGGYSYEMLMTNEALGGAPFFSRYRLHPAITVSGRVVDQKGKPLAGVEVSGSWLNEHVYSGGGYSTNTTSENGVFRLNLSPGNKAFLWFKSPRHSIEQIFINEVSEKDFGDIPLSNGNDVEVAVVDAESRPVSGIEVDCMSVAAQEECESHETGTSVMYSVVSDDQGKCHFPSLACGEYRLFVQTYRNDPAPAACFMKQNMRVVADVEQTHTYQATPHVMLTGRTVDSNGNPRNGHLPFFFCEASDGEELHAESTRGEEKGTIQAMIPVTARSVKVSVSSDSHTAFMMEFGKQKTCCTSTIEMEGVDGSKDYDDLKITWFDTTLLLLEVVDSNGKPAAVGCTGYYAERLGHVSFNRQRGNELLRSNAIVPDLELTLHIDVVDEGSDELRCFKKTVVLTEGETRKLRVVV